jgi:rhamnosyltransferase
MKLLSPKVVILMATYNGINWINEQIESILNQVDVNVTIFVSDDNSSDGTYELLEALAVFDGRIALLPRVNGFGSAGKNFYRLICDVAFKDFDYVSFADQDDIWDLDKLSRHIKLIRQHQADCVSSNVIALWPDNSQRLINKSQKQKEWDFIFESAGPGCSFLMTPFLLSKVKEHLQSKTSVARDVMMHDWLVYAVCRANGLKWFIDYAPSLMYRQHANNVIGANFGIKAIYLRLRKIYIGLYRYEVSKVGNVCLSMHPDKKLVKLVDLLTRRTFFAQLQLLTFVPQARRRFLDRVVLGFLITLFIF